MLQSALTLAFYRFLRAGEFATPNLSWSNIQLNIDSMAIIMVQSKTDPFNKATQLLFRSQVHQPAPSESSVVMLKKFHCYNDVDLAGRFSPLTRQHLTTTLHYLLQNTEHNQASEMVPTPLQQLQDFLHDLHVKTLGRLKSDTYQVYTHLSPAILQSAPTLLARAKISSKSA